MTHFARIDHFLKNSRNKEYADLYYDAASEIKEKIILARDSFSTFDEIFVYLYRQVQKRRDPFRRRRRLISIMLHHMYFNCNIGSKDIASEAINADA
jgi:hypothetical protein